MQMFKHVLFVGNPGQLVDGPLVGMPVPNIRQNYISMQHETTHSIRSVSPTPQEQTQACGWPGALSHLRVGDEWESFKCTVFVFDVLSAA